MAKEMSKMLEINYRQLGALHKTAVFFFVILIFVI
jgi:hypothetical protein